MKPNKKILDKIEKIEGMVQDADKNYEIQDAELRRQYSITDEQYAGDAPLHDQQYDYLEPASQMLSDHLAHIARLKHKQAALLLIAHNIAHRGRPLHVETVKRKLDKLGKYAHFIQSELSTHARAPYIVDDNISLHTELKKRGILLVDLNTLSGMHSAIDCTTQQKRMLEHECAHRIRLAPNAPETQIAIAKLAKVERDSATINREMKKLKKIAGTKYKTNKQRTK